MVVSPKPGRPLQGLAPRGMETLIRCYRGTASIRPDASVKRLADVISTGHQVRGCCALAPRGSLPHRDHHATRQLPTSADEHLQRECGSGPSVAVALGGPRRTVVARVSPCVARAYALRRRGRRAVVAGRRRRARRCGGDGGRAVDRRARDRHQRRRPDRGQADVTLQTPHDPDRTTSVLKIRAADIEGSTPTEAQRGADSLTPPTSAPPKFAVMLATLTND